MREEERNVGRSEVWNPSRKRGIILGTIGPRIMVVEKYKQRNTQKQKHEPRQKKEIYFP